MNNRYSVSLSLTILSVAALVSGSTATTMVYASSHATSSSNTGSPSSTPSTSGSSSTPSTSGSFSLHQDHSLVVQDRRHQVAAVAVVEVLHIVIGQAIRPVLVSVRLKVERGWN